MDEDNNGKNLRIFTKKNYYVGLKNKAEKRKISVSGMKNPENNGDGCSVVLLEL